MAHFICTKCGNEVVTRGDDRPTPLPWSDGHRCQNYRLDTETPELQAEIIKRVDETRVL